MKLNYSFETIEMGNELIAVPIGDRAELLRGVIRLNNSGLEILDLLKSEITEEEIVNILAEKYDDDRHIISSYVHNAISIMYENGLIV